MSGLGRRRRHHRRHRGRGIFDTIWSGIKQYAPGILRSTKALSTGAKYIPYIGKTISPLIASQGYGRRRRRRHHVMLVPAVHHRRRRRVGGAVGGRRRVHHRRRRHHGYGILL